jgi:N-acetyl-anhydromuramyl-L-alanine amidase AmpD
VYAHASGANAETVGIELAHSGRSDDPFPEAQVRSVAWLVRTLLEMSGGRLAAADVVGHKDLDDRPAYVDESCHRDGCAFYVDDAIRPFHRRVDPPEALFTALARFGVVIPRSGSAGDRELLRAEAIPASRIPKTRR